MKHLDELPSLRLQPANRRAYIPFDMTNKKKGAAILLLSPNEETSYKMMNLPYIYNPQYFTAYYLDRKVDTYINRDKTIPENDMQEFIDAHNEAVLHSIDTSYDKADNDIIHTKRNIKFEIISGSAMEKREALKVYNVSNYSFWADRLGLRKGDFRLNIYIHTSLNDFEEYLRQNDVREYDKYIIYSYTDGNNIHILSRYCYLANVMDGPYETYLLNELISYMINRINPRFDKKLINAMAIGISGQYPYIEKNSKLKEGVNRKCLTLSKFFYDNIVLRKNWLDFKEFIQTGNVNCLKSYMITPVVNNMKKLFSEFGIIDEESGTVKSFLFEATGKFLHNSLEDVNKIVNKIPKSEREDIGDRSDGNKGEELVVYRKTINNSAFIEVYKDNSHPGEGAIVIGAAPDARGKGYTDSLIKDASRECPKLGITRLCWKCDFKNKHSYNLALRNGFVDKTEKDYTMYWLEKELSSIIKEAKENYNKYSKDIHIILDSLSKKDSEHVGGGYWIDSNHVIYRKVEYEGSKPIGFIDIYALPRFKNYGLIVFAVTDEARGKGIGKKLIQSAINNLKNSNKVNGLRWLADDDNEVSIHMAKSLGFRYTKDTEDNCKEFIYEFNNINEFTLLQEKYIINEKDKHYNLDKWMHGKNILFVTGLSGGGKSTKARQLATEFHAIYIELDQISHAFDFKDNPSKNRQDEIWIAEFLKENNITKDPMKMSDAEHDKYFLKCMDYLVSKAKADSGNLYVFEGIQVIKYGRYNNYIFGWPMIIKGTSMLKSILNRKKRDKETNELFDDFGIDNDFKDSRSLFDLMSWYMDQEYSLGCLRKAVKSYTEASFINSDGKRVPKICPKCGSKVRVYLKGEPVYLCSNKDCEEYFGTLQFRESGAIISKNSFSDKYDDVLTITNSLPENEFKRISFTDQYMDSPFVVYRDIYYDDGRPVSFIDVTVYPSQRRIAQITAATVPECRGLGYTSTLLSNLIYSDFAKNNDIGTYVWNVHPDNIPSSRVAEKNGFTYYGIDNGYGAKSWCYETEVSNDDYLKFLNMLASAEETTIDEGIIEGPGYIGILDENDNVQEIYFDSEYMLEAAPVDSKRMRKFLYNERIKTNGQQLEQLRKAEEANPWLKKIFVRLDLYKEYNIFIDMSYYHGIFLKNNTITLDRGIKLYFEFLNKMINNKEYDEWAKKTIYIPMFPNTWGTYSPEIYDYKKKLNILSMIARLLRKDPDMLKKAWGDKIIVFVGQNGYFRVDFNTLTFNKLPKFKKLCDKLLMNQVITQADLIEEDDDDEIVVNNDEGDSTKAIVTSIIDRIENNTGIKIDNIATGSARQNSIDRADHLRIKTQEYIVDDPKSTFIGILAPDDKSFEKIMYNNIIKNSDEILSYVKK